MVKEAVTVFCTVADCNINFVHVIDNIHMTSIIALRVTPVKYGFVMTLTFVDEVHDNSHKQ
jgi:hypothetical protein